MQLLANISNVIFINFIFILSLYYLYSNKKFVTKNKKNQENQEANTCLIQSHLPSLISYIFYNPKLVNRFSENNHLACRALNYFLQDYT